MKSTSSRYLLIFLLIGLFLFPIIAIGLTAISANADSSADKNVFMPVTLNGYFEGSTQEGIAGRVLAYGKPAADTNLDLRRYDENNNEIIVKSTKTNEAGYYLFQDIGSLGDGENYYVSFGRNESNPKLVYFWYGPIIESYNKGDIVFGGSFDIADAPLESPESGEIATLPVNFNWQRRGLPGDSYRLVFIDKDDLWRSPNLGDVDSFTLNSLPEGMEFGNQYAWYIEVYMGPDNFGESYMINEIIFKQSNIQQKSISEELFTRGTGRGGR